MKERKKGGLLAFIRGRDGFIVILVLCIMVLLFAFGGGMLIAASTTLGSADAAVKQEQVYLTAWSAGELIRSDLTLGGDIKAAAGSLATGTSCNVTVTSAKTGTATCTLTLTEKNGKTLLDADILAEYSDASYNMHAIFERSGQANAYAWKFKEYRVD